MMNFWFWMFRPPIIHEIRKKRPSVNYTVRLALFFLAGLFPLSVSAQESNEAICLQAIKADPNNETAHLNLGIIYLNSQKFEQAVPEFQKCVQLKPTDSQAKELLELCLGMTALNKGDYQGGMDHFQNVLKVNPDNKDAKRLLVQCQAKVYLDEKKYSQAVTALNQITQDDPQNYFAYKNLGFIYFQEKDYKKSVDYWEHAIKLQQDSQIYQALGFSFYNLGDFNNAIENYKKSIQLEIAKGPKDQDINSLDQTYYNLGVAYLDNASYDEAADAFGNAFKINPKDSNAAVNQANAIQGAIDTHLRNAANFMLNSQYSDAISEANKVLKQDPNNKQAQGFIQDAQTKMGVEIDKHYGAGKNYLKKGNTIQALNEWNLALTMDPSNQKVQSAIKTLKVNRLSRIKALVTEGDQYYQAEDYSNALSSYNKAKEIDPHSSLVKSKLKKLFTKQSSEVDGVYEKAKKAYSKGDLKNAQKYVSLAKDLAPNNDKIADTFFKIQKDISLRVKTLDAEGISLFNSGNKEKAKEKFQEVLKLKSNDETADDYIKQLTGQQAQEKVDAEKVKALYYEGVNLYINGKIHEAIEKWDECLKLDPSNTNAQSNKNKAMVKLQSIEKLSHN